MTLEQFTEHVAEYHDRLLAIATEQWFAILMLTTVSDEKNGNNTFWVTNMDSDGISRSHWTQSYYAHALAENL